MALRVPDILDRWAEAAEQLPELRRLANDSRAALLGAATAERGRAAGIAEEIASGAASSDMKAQAQRIASAIRQAPKP